MKLEFLAEARQDLENIYDHIAADDLGRAGAFIERIEERCRDLVRLPLMGRERRDLGPGLRCLTFGQYLILYRLGGDVLQIVNVIHGARDLLALFKQDKE